MENERIVSLTTDQIGILKILISNEQGRLMRAETRNETMIAEMRELLTRLRQARRPD